MEIYLDFKSKFILNTISKLLYNELKFDSNMTMFNLEIKNLEEIIENYEKNYRHEIVSIDLVF